MDIKIYLEPIGFGFDDLDFADLRERIAHKISAFYKNADFPDLEGANLAIIGVKEDRKSVNNFGCENAPDEIRKKLYKLFPSKLNMNLVDLGNIKKRSFC